MSEKLHSVATFAFLVVWVGAWGGGWKSVRDDSKHSKLWKQTSHKLSAQATVAVVAPLLVLAPTSDQTARHGVFLEAKMTAGRRIPQIK